MTQQKLLKASGKETDLKKFSPDAPSQLPPKELAPALGVINGILISLLFWIVVLTLSLFVF